MIFRSIFGGSKSPILSLKTPFVKNAEKTYFGSENFSKSDHFFFFFQESSQMCEICQESQKITNPLIFDRVRALFQSFFETTKMTNFIGTSGQNAVFPPLLAVNGVFLSIIVLSPT